MKPKIILTQACIALACLLLPSAPVRAETWQLGIALENSRSPFLDDRRESNVLPLVNYIGDRFSFVSGKLYYQLDTVDGHATYAVAQFRARQFYSASLDSNDDLALQGMQARKTAFEMGLGYKHEATWGQLVVAGLFDVSGAHEGFDLTASYSYPQQAGRWMIEPGLGVQLQSSDLVDYYHGVRADEVQDNRPAYRGTPAINVMASLTLGYALSPRLLAIAAVEQITLDNAITDSPIIARRHVRKAYLGLLYTF